LSNLVHSGRRAVEQPHTKSSSSCCFLDPGLQVHNPPAELCSGKGSWRDVLRKEIGWLWRIVVRPGHVV